MPELAEVEFYRLRWHEAALGQAITDVLTHDNKNLFRAAPASTLKRALRGATLLDSGTAAKQMLFRFTGNHWLGIHLGMSGELFVRPTHYQPQKHDHLVLRTQQNALVFSDPRLFGKIEFSTGPTAPAWWTKIAPAVLSATFTQSAVTDFLRRRARAPIKAVLLMQERFPGIGNWMADEILWRAAIHPRRLAGSLTPAETRALWRECRQVCRLALRHIAGRGGKLPPDLNVNIPDTWLFNHRWKDGGRCPKTRALLIREEIGGRTTCWSPGRQNPAP
ncbi:MAG: Fpg/Nei family DNA glycosylase [Opitutaceae bacterium]|nr:Fpg/Nei family DNA glycosylase [Opitutaceae bacterium]